MTASVAFGRVSHLEPSLMIVGCGRSGTTLLRREVLRNFITASTPEASFLQRTIQHVGASSRIGLHDADQLIAQLRASVHFKSWKVDLPSREQLAELTAREFACCLYATFAFGKGMSTVVDKTPRNIVFLDELMGVFQRCQFACMIRNPVDVVASTITQGWGYDVSAAAGKWLVRNRQIIRHLGNPRFQLVRYEDLVCDGGGIATKVGRAAGLLQRLTPLAITGLDLDGHDLSLSPLLAEPLRTGPSGNILSIDEKVRVENVCHPIMSMFGYERATDERGDRGEEDRAAAVRAYTDMEARERHQRAMSGKVFAGPPQ